MSFRSLLPAALLAGGCFAASLPQPHPHPRLQIDPALLQQIRTLRDQKDPAWTRLERWSGAQSGKSGGPAAGVQAVYGRMLVYLVTGDRAQFDQAWTAVRGRIYKNGADRQGGLSKLLDLFHGDR